MATIRIDKTRDYTVMSNHHLRNTALSLKAKGLMSLMLSLPDEWDYTIKGLAAICRDGVDSISSALKELEAHRYLIRTRSRNEKGHLTDTEYTLFEHPSEEARVAKPLPEPEPPKQENPVLDNEDAVEPKPENPILDNPVLGKPEQENRPQLSTKILSTNESSTDSIHPIPPDSRTPVDKVDEMDEIDAMEAYRQVVKDNIAYETVAARYGVERTDELVELMLEVICSTKPRIYIAGESRYGPLVKARLLKLEQSHIEYVLEAMDKQTVRIRNIRSYLLTALYHAPSTMNSYYTAAVNHDLSRGPSEVYST